MSGYGKRLNDLERQAWEKTHAKYNFQVQYSSDIFAQVTAEHAEARVKILLAVKDAPGACVVSFVRFGIDKERHFESFVEACQWTKEASQESSEEWCSVRDITLSTGDIIRFSPMMEELDSDGTFTEYTAKWAEEEDGDGN